jgi:purine-nucleoside phosphorylase
MLDPREVESTAEKTAGVLAGKLGVQPKLAVVLGTGWGMLAEPHRTISEADFSELPGFGGVSAPNHAGKVKAVETAAGPVLVQDGRMHCYEGYSALETTFPIWVYEAMGVKALLLLAAAGGLNPSYVPGDLIVLTDHVYLWGSNPLAGVPPSQKCERYVFDADFYPERMREAVKAAVPPEARCEQGIYVFMNGPSFETEAEAVILRVAGADAVGMSTAAEAIVARYLGLETGAMCCISNTILPYRAGGSDVASLLDVVGGAVAALDGFLDKLASAIDVIT